jgi:hypothetical protein
LFGGVAAPAQRQHTFLCAQGAALRVEREQRENQKALLITKKN